MIIPITEEYHTGIEYHITNKALNVTAKDYRNNDRDRNNQSKRKTQQLIGLLGEIAVSQVLGGYIDYEVYPINSPKITHEPDLSNSPTNLNQHPEIEYMNNLHTNFKTIIPDDIRIHVKTRAGSYSKLLNRMIPNHNLGWLIAKSDPVAYDPQDADIIVLTTADPNTFMTQIDGWIIAQDLYGEMATSTNYPNKWQITEELFKQHATKDITRLLD